MFDRDARRNQLKVAVFNADQGGCGWYRLLFAARHLRDQGADIAISPQLEAERLDHPLYGDRLNDVLVDADVVVLQRPLRRELVEAIPVLQRRGVAVVCEIDDDFHSLPKSHPAVATAVPRHNPDRNWQWLRRGCEQSDLVTCTTSALASRYAPHGRVVVLPNCVPEWYLEVEGKPNDRPIVGWTGTSQTHIGDLDVCGDAIARVQQGTGCGFRAVGSQSTLELLGVDGETVEWCALTDRGEKGYAATVASLDVGLVPLVDSAFNRAKSALKMAEYAALGVVPVMSPTPDNIRMFQHGIGFLADTPADWFRHVRALVSDEQLRCDEVGRGREAMRGWTVEGNAHRWWEAWTLALANRHTTSAAA